MTRPRNYSRRRIRYVVAMHDRRVCRVEIFWRDSAEGWRFEGCQSVEMDDLQVLKDPPIRNEEWALTVRLSRWSDVRNKDG